MSMFSVLQLQNTAKAQPQGPLIAAALRRARKIILPDLANSKVWVRCACESWLSTWEIYRKPDQGSIFPIK